MDQESTSILEKEIWRLWLIKKPKIKLWHIAYKFTDSKQSFFYYLMNEDIKKAHLNLNLGNNVKKVLENKVKRTNITNQIYLNLVAEQIIRDICL